MNHGRLHLAGFRRAVTTVIVTCTALLSVQLLATSSAFANAADPDPTTAGTFTVNGDGTVTANLQGTWTFVNQDCQGRYGQGYAVDWWGVSTSALPSPNFTLTNATTVTAPGVTGTGSVTATGSIQIGSTGMYFHVGPKYAGETVNTAATCTDVGRNSVGAWSASATYPSQADIPPAVCVNMYDEHGKQGEASHSASDYDPVADHDNSIQTNHFDPTMGGGYCVALEPTGQTIQGEIYACVNGAPSTTLVSGGTLAVPAASLSSANPLAATQVDAGTYTMNATAPSGQQFVACGQSGVTITSSTSASQPVTVPAGGSGDGKFYVTPVGTTGTGYLEVCKSNANSVSGNFSFYISALHKSITVPAGACTHPIKVPAGNVLVEENARANYEFVGVSASPVDRAVNIDPSRHNITVRVVAGGIAKEVVVTFVNKHATGTVKVCQIAGSGIAVGTTFGFTTSAGGGVTNVPAGRAPGGYCAVLGSAWLGYVVTITQQIPTGDSVSSITAKPSRRLQAYDLGAGSATIKVGAGVTEVTYTDQRP